MSDRELTLETVIEEVETWLTEEKDDRIRDSRIAKLRWLMQWGFVSLQQAEDIFAMTRPDGSKDPV